MSVSDILPVWGILGVLVVIGGAIAVVGWMACRWWTSYKELHRGR